MDIELLSRMVGELILDNDKVVLPGLGAFVAEMEPASFSDRGYTINPPYRKLSFRGGDDADDGILASFYASNNSIPVDVAGKIIKEFTAGLKSALFQQRMLVLPGLGRLRTTREGKVFLIPDENLDIYPAGLGLDPISLKSHSKPQSFDFSQLDIPVAATPEETPSVEEAPVIEEPVAPEGTPSVEETPSVEDTPSSVEEAQPAEAIPVLGESEAPEQPELPAEPETGAVAEEVTAEEPEAVTAEEPEEAPAEEPEEDAEEVTVETSGEIPAEEPEEVIDHDAYFETEDDDDDYDDLRPGMPRALKIILITLGIIVLLLALAAGAVYLMSHYWPDILDRILYSKEELELIHYYGK